jgi:hypothetical protein
MLVPSGTTIRPPSGHFYDEAGPVSGLTVARGKLEVGHITDVAKKQIK